MPGVLCDDLRDELLGLDHPLARDRVASTLAAALLVELPHNYSRALEAAETWIAPASVRRAERFIEENAINAIGLAGVACAAGVSARALQRAFRRFRNTTPMAHLRALRLELAPANSPGLGETAALSLRLRTRTALSLSADSRPATEHASTNRLPKRYAAVASR